MFINRIIGGVSVPCVALYIVAILLIVVYGFIIRTAKCCDALGKEFFHHPICQNIDGWSVTHLLFFGLLGVMYPGNHLQFILVGAGWEVVETVLGQNKLGTTGHRIQLIGEQDSAGNSTGNNDAYWYGKESDIVVDAIGYCLGSAWADKYWPNRASTCVQQPAHHGRPPADAAFN